MVAKKLKKTTPKEDVARLTRLRADLRPEYDSITSEWLALGTSLSEARKALGAEDYSAAKAKGGIAHLRAMVKEDGTVEHDSDQYKDYAKWCQDHSFYPGGYFPQTQQRSPQIKLHRKDGAAGKSKITKGVRSLITVLEPVTIDKVETPIVDFDIFEHSCSEFGSYHMYYHPEDKTFEVVMWKYHKPHSQTPRGTLKAALDYIEQYAFYE